MTKSAVTIALFPPIAPTRVVQGNEFDLGFEAGRMSAETAAAAAISALRLAFEAARSEAETANLLVRDEMIAATRRLLVACAPVLAANKAVEALFETLSVTIEKHSPVSISVAPDIADAVRTLAGAATVEVDQTLPLGAANVRWRNGGAEMTPLHTIDSIIDLITQKRREEPLA